MGDLSLLFPKTKMQKIDALNNRIELAAHQPPRYDVLFGLRNLNGIKTQFAKYGVVQLKNFLNLIECEWLKKHYLMQTNIRKTNDRISYFYLQHFNEIMSYLVGKNVKKSYSQFIDFNETMLYKKYFAKTLSADSTYTLLLTISQNQNTEYQPFPFYFDMMRKPQSASSKKRYFNIGSYSDQYELISNVGDAILFKGSEMIHFAPYANTMQAQNYLTLFFNYVDIKYEFA